MSTSALRRYRAERLLREEFEGMRGRVLATVRGRLRAAGIRLDMSDLEAAYAQAWQGLYQATLEGQEIVSPTAWLALVSYRRALEEHRARSRVGCGVADCAEVPSEERDLAAELDDRTRLRQLFEGLRGRLSAREQEAASLCYLQGLSRSEAAARMGVSDARMRKLMEGRAPGSPGVAGKVGTLVETIRAGAWCEEQGSLMRGFAYGILDPQGERYRLALLHREECPACRAYVISLRGLAAVLPPVPSLAHLALGAGSIAGKGVGAGAGAGTGSGAAAGTTIGTSSGAGAGALSASGAAGAGAAGGGWLLAGGPLGAKLAVGCLLALGVGAGCVALGGNPISSTPPTHRSAVARHRSSQRSGGLSATYANAGVASDRAGSPGSAPGPAGAGGRAGPAPGASREFGLERASSTAVSRSNFPARQSAPAARAATVAGGTHAGFRAGAEASSSAVSGRAEGPSAAQREFAPG